MAFQINNKKIFLEYVENYGKLYFVLHFVTSRNWNIFKIKKYKYFNFFLTTFKG